MNPTIPHLVLGVTATLFVACALHSVFYVGVKRGTGLYWALLTLFFGAMCGACLTENLAGMWVAIEATTLLSAPLICWHKSAESIEAMWKYLLICSVGIGLALFGTLLYYHGWHKPAFIFILAGYGTKMGLAPFHTWLPDAHSEAPGPVSAFLSGALLNCSFLAIWRFRALMPQEIAPFCDQAMIALGVLSLLVAAVFIVRQTDFKRLLAYSSVEHMGLILILFALAADPRVLSTHIVFHSLTKMTLFLVAGNLLLAYGTREIAAIHGLGRTMKLYAALWMLGILMICGFPPGGLFLTELGLVYQAPIWLAAVVLVLLFIVFAGMSRAAVGMVFGNPDRQHSVPARPISPALAVVPTLGLATVLLGGLVLTILVIVKGGVR